MGLLLLAPACWADQAASQPDRPPRVREGKLDIPRHVGPPIRSNKPITPQQEQELLETLRQRQPERYERLTKLRKDDPPAYRRLTTIGWAWYQEWKDLPPGAQDAYLQMGESRAEILRLVHKYVQAKDDDARQDVRGKLRAAVSTLMSSEQVVMQSRLEAIQAQAAKLQAELEHRRANHEQLVDRHLKRLMKSIQEGKVPRGRSSGPASQPAAPQPTSQPANP
jgi:hypothetical protein